MCVFDPEVNSSGFFNYLKLNKTCMLIGEHFKILNKPATKTVLITEGGNAISNASRINQENVAATMEVVYKKLLHFLG